MRDYQFISPSLEGVFCHSSLEYEGVTRPLDVMRVLDGPAAKGKKGKVSEEEQRILEQYFGDLYSVFLKKLSAYALESQPEPETTLKLQAIFQEMLKIKKLMAK